MDPGFHRGDDKDAIAGFHWNDETEIELRVVSKQKGGLIFQ